MRTQLRAQPLPTACGRIGYKTRPVSKKSPPHTGGNAPVIVRYCRNPIVYDKYLLMDGLWAIYQKNK